MQIKKSICVAVCLLMVLMLMHSTSVSAESYAIKNATLVTVTNGIIRNGTIVIQGDKITAMGTNVSIPADAEVIDGHGLYVYPGLFDASTILGLNEVGAVAATVDAGEAGTFNPHIQAWVAMNPHTVHIPISRFNGITSALVFPSGGVISGQCAVIHLKGSTPEEMTMKTPAAMAVSFPALPRKVDRRGQPVEPKDLKKAQEQYDKQMKEMKEVFQKAKRYAATWENYTKTSKLSAPDKDLMMEAMVPVIKKEVPVMISVNREKDIKCAVKFVKELDIKAIFRGVNDGWKVAHLLNKHDIPVIVGPVLQVPGPKDPYDARYANAGMLHKAGVKVAFFTGGAADVRSLPYHAGFAAAYGLPKEEALKGVTINPAEILGVADKVGSLDVGKLANIIVTDGDPLEMLTHVKHLFICGEKLPLKSKHTELYEQFIKRMAPKK